MADTHSKANPQNKEYPVSLPYPLHLIHTPPYRPLKFILCFTFCCLIKNKSKYIYTFFSFPFS